MRSTLTRDLMETEKANNVGLWGCYFHKDITTTLKTWLKASLYLEREAMNIGVDYLLGRILKHTT